MSLRAGRAIALACGLLFAAVAGAEGDTADVEIQYLLGYVAESGCTFERNGDSHDAADAADHLRLKYTRGRRYADTAEHFIDRLASRSSWSGKAYSVTCGGNREPSGEWLHRALAEYRRQRT
jgi:hypothetical protein